MNFKRKFILLFVSVSVWCFGAEAIAETSGDGNSQHGTVATKVNAEDLISTAQSLIQKKRYTEAQAILVKASSAGSDDADAMLATSSTWGVMNYYTYAEAIDTLRRLGERGNLYAARAYAVLWTTSLPNPAHHQSFVKAYFAMSKLRSLSPEDDLYKLLPNGNETRKRFKKTNSQGWFNYTEHKDEMTDKVDCEVTSYAIGGLFVGLDSHGLYAAGKIPLSLQRYDSMGLRIDEGKFYQPPRPQELDEADKITHDISWLVARHMLSGAQGLERIKKETANLLRANKIYIAKAGTELFNAIVEEMATGKQLKVRGVFTDGKIVTETIKLRGTAGKSKELQDVNIFDGNGYAFLNCLYGNLN